MSDRSGRRPIGVGPRYSRFHASHPFCSDLEECEPGWFKFQGFCYQHFSKRLSWEAAEQHCRLCGGHLISVMTPEEQDYVNGNEASTLAWCHCQGTARRFSECRYRTHPPDKSRRWRLVSVSEMFI